MMVFRGNAPGNCWPSRIGCLLIAATVFCGRLQSADRHLSRPIAPGVVYETIRREEYPREIRLLRVRRDATNIRLQTVLGQGTVKGVERLNGMIEREQARDDTQVVAAVNADFFVMWGNPNAGLPTGPCVSQSEILVTGRHLLAYMVMEDGTPAIGEIDVKARVLAGNDVFTVGSINTPHPQDSLRIDTAKRGWATRKAALRVHAEGLPLRSRGRWEGRVADVLPPDHGQTADANHVLVVPPGDDHPLLERLKPGDPLVIEIETPGIEQSLQLAAGGGPRLLHGGAIVVDRKNTARHPRTAVGFNEEETCFVTVDGRQPGWATGVTLHELAAIMAEFGCTEALNLDGGGSTTCWVRGETVNRPSDGAQRMVANAILIRSNTPRGPWTQLLARPQTLVMFAHTEERIQLFCTDDGYHPVDEPAAGFAVAVTQHGNDTVSAAWNRGKLGVGGDAGQATVTIHPQGATEPAAMIDLSVIKACDSLTLRPSVLALRPEASGSFDIRGRHGAVAGIAVPAGALSWTLPGDAVSMTRPGRFKGRKPGTRTVITARLGQAEARADVAVTERVRLDELDTREGWSVNRYPPQGSHHVEAAIMTETHPRERRFVRLTFDLGEPERTRAVYLRLDRDLGHALSLEFDARSRGGSPWIRVALRDARNRRHTMTAKSRLDPAEGWQTCNLNLPETWAWPVTLESIYVVETAGKTCQGQLDLDTITVERIPATPTVPGQP